MLRWLRTVLQVILTVGVTLLLASVFNPDCFQPKATSRSFGGSFHLQHHDFLAQSRTYGKDEARAGQGPAAALAAVGSNLKPVLRIAYCSFPQDLKLEYTTAEIELVARGLAEPLQDRYVVHLEPCAANQQHIDRYKKENGLSMTREEELDALGLNADIRICFFSTTEIVAILKEERNGHIEAIQIPEKFQHTFTADYMLYWPQDIRHIVDDNGDPVGPVLVRRSSESWGQFSEGVAIQLESKRHRGSLQEHGVAMYLPFVVTSLLARAKTDDPTPSGFTLYHGCCFQDKNSILQDATRRVGYFNPTQERIRKTGFASFLQTHCHSHLLSTSLRHAFVFALSEYKNVSLLGGCPRGISATKRLGYESENERSAFRKQFRPYDAVTVHSHFKFSIVMENSIVPGYVTEKFAEAYLARSIPIYLGSDPFSMQQTFNPRAFIYCDLSRDSFSEKILSKLQASMCDGNHESTPEGRECNYQFDLAVLELTRPSFAKCLAEVIRLDNDDKAYEEMLSEPLLPNHGQLSGPWNFTHHANVLDLVYRVLRKGSQQYHWTASSWSPPHNIKGVPKFVFTKH